MAFLVYERFRDSRENLIRPTGEGFSLAGRNVGLIYKAWESMAKPTNEGWHVSADELIRIQSDGAHDASTRLLVVDWHPDSKWRIGLIELLDIYAYTWSDDNIGASWTPLMLRFRDVRYEDQHEGLETSQRQEIMAILPEPSSDAPDFVEFLYLNGDDKGWTWGMSGMTNAAFLSGEARDYFRQFF